MNQRVVIGMSGGVDSSVAASLLVEAGYEVIGVTLRLAHAMTGAEDDLRDAQHAARNLGIEHTIIDRSEQFEKLVVQSFADAYAAGTTPSPCPGCNRLMKFPALLEAADRHDASWIATGHYANVRKTEQGVWRISRAKDPSKDQSYFLALLGDDVLARLLLPLAAWTKPRVREHAKTIGWHAVGSKRDSQDLCFVPDGDYVSVVESRAKNVPLPGPFVDRQGNLLGQHRGVHTVTIGQRKGLGVSAGERLFVCGLDAAQRRVVLGSSDDVFCRELVVNTPHVSSGEKLDRRLRAQVRYRHHGQWAHARLSPSGQLHLAFEQPVRAASPGQLAVLYDGDDVVAGGFISQTQGVAR